MHSPLIAQFRFKGQLLCTMSHMHSRHNRGTGGIVEIAGHFFFARTAGHWLILRDNPAECRTVGT